MAYETDGEMAPYPMNADGETGRLEAGASDLREGEVRTVGEGTTMTTNETSQKLFDAFDLSLSTREEITSAAEKFRRSVNATDSEYEDFVKAAVLASVSETKPTEEAPITTLVPLDDIPA